MTASTHEYTATIVVGEDEYPLGIRRNGRITLDEGSAPHVTADLDLALPDEATQLLLDPRQAARVRIDVAATFPASTQARTFDLSLRSRPIGHGPDAVASVSLASDEALLETYRAGADDDAPFDLAASLRDVVEYVLDTVIPGAALEAAPANDADVTAVWPLTNLIPNPVLGTDLVGYAPGTGASALTRGTGGVYPQAQWVRWTGAAGSSYLHCPSVSVREGEQYTFRASVESATTSRTARFVMRCLSADGVIIRDIASPNFATGIAPSWVDQSMTFTVPAGVNKVTPLINVINGGAAQFHFAAAIQMVEGPINVPFFSGDKPDDATYEYAWTETAHASASTRTPIIPERRPEALTWHAGDSALDFLHPLVQAAGFRLVCDEQRRWTLRDETYTAPGSLTVREGVNMIDGEDVIDIDRGLWFDAQATIYRDPKRLLPDQVDYYELNSPPTVVNRVEVDTAYVGPGRSEYAVRRAQGRGREVTVTLVADWRAHAEQPAVFTLTGAPIQTGQTSRVEFDLSNDRMTVTSRTTDTPPLAWVLIPVGESWLDSPIGESWTEEVA